MTMRIAGLAGCALMLAACGKGTEAPANGVESAPDAAVASEAELADDAALADEAARAEAEDAAIGGNLSGSDVSAAGNAQ